MKKLHCTKLFYKYSVLFVRRENYMRLALQSWIRHKRRQRCVSHRSGSNYNGQVISCEVDTTWRPERNKKATKRRVYADVLSYFRDAELGRRRHIYEQDRASSGPASFAFYA